MPWKSQIVPEGNLEAFLRETPPPPPHTDRHTVILRRDGSFGVQIFEDPDPGEPPELPTR